MYKICKTEASVKRQIEFYNVLEEMMGAQNFREITISSLCREMGVPRKAFYRYFDTLEDVLYSKMDTLIQGAFLTLDVTPNIEEFFQFWKKHKKFLDLLEKNGMSQYLVNRIYQNFYSNSTAERVAEKGTRYTIYISAFMSALISWHHNGMKQTPKEMEALMLSIFKMD